MPRLSRCMHAAFVAAFSVTVMGLPALADRAYNDRMAAWHHSIVATDELRPNSCVGTYIMDRMSIDQLSLAKLVVGVEAGGRVVWPESAKDVRVEDFPGGVRAEYTLAGVKVTTEIIPLMVGRDTPAHDGAALYTVTTSPLTPVVVRCGEGAVSGFSAPRAAWLRSDLVGADGDSAEVSGDIAIIKSAKHPVTVAVKSSGAISVEKGVQGGSIALARFERGQGSLIVSFGPDQSAARAIMPLDERSARKQVSDYYARLLRCKVETPEKTINQAFTTALYNLEYNWLAPYGWNECIHHWPALWHMQHTAGCEWIGQADRSRDCNLVTAEHLFPSGAVPQFMPSGITKRDFGGSNQYFAWQIRHYWNFTADRDSIAKLAPVLDRVIDQTFEEYDPDRDGLLAWGQQIGNQEDYVSTPYNGTATSIEGINMLRTAAELWRALGQTEKAVQYERRAMESLARLRSELWQPELGFFAFYKDPQGVIRPDGQYHTLIYPVIWGVMDPLDSWTSMRHLRDRMTGADGECYLSNGFPNHVPGTWGMQTGVAQQPWAAKGLAAIGLRNETYRPLKAAADWVMNRDHRGSWPEVSVESTAAYFSPPAGLYIQATVEALFGLRVYKPAGCMLVAPSFPDTWPSARLILPDYSATYARKGDRIEYSVASRTPLARRLRWMLPPCRVMGVKVNGRPVKWKTLPGVRCVTLCVDTQPMGTTRFDITFKPIAYSVRCPQSVAEGDSIAIESSAFAIERIEDRSRVLSGISPASKSRVQATVRVGQLAPYMGCGRLGQMNFSRRTVFLWGSAPGGVKFWVPLDLTVLPRFECAARGEVTPTRQGTEVRLLVRNNSSSRLAGDCILKAVRSDFPFRVDLAPRTEREYRVTIPASLFGLFSTGENRASVMLPGNRELGLTLVVSSLLGSDAKLAQYASSRIKTVALPEADLVPDTKWRELREWYAYGHMPWAWSKPPLEALDGKPEVTVPGLSGVTSKLAGRGFAPISWKTAKPTYILDLNGASCRKLYLLVIPFLDNHDTYAPVARVDVWTGDRTVFSRTLSFPGDLDWWCPQEVVGDFSTARNPREDRFGLLPLLRSGQGDWNEAKPAAFPQPEFWATCLPLKTATSVMSVIEIDLGRAMPVKNVSLTALGVDPAFGLVAVSYEGSGDDALLTGTPYAIPARYREPTTVFSFTKEGDLLGWRTEGEAFSVAAHAHLFPGTPTLNSLCKSGEAATGRAISPDFQIGPEDTRLLLKLQGGNSTGLSGLGSLAISLVDASTGEALERIQANGSHLLRDGRIPVERWRGRKVRVELSDENTGPSYAWLGIKEVRLSAN